MSIVGVALIGCLSLAVSAQASEPPHWMVAGSAFTGTESVAVAKNEIGGFRLTAPASATETRCASLSVGEASIKESNKGTLQPVFTECIVEGAKASCKVHSLGAPAGTIVFAPLKAELLHIAPNYYEKLSPAAGTTFTNLVYEKTLGHTCSVFGSGVPGGVAVTGSTAGLLSSGEGTERSLTFNSASASAASTGLVFGSSPFLMEGVADLVLTGAHKGSTWGAS